MNLTINQYFYKPDLYTLILKENIMELFRNEQEDDKTIISRLGKNAGHIIYMLKSVLSTHENSINWKLLAHASGLAGYACHKAVVENHEEFVLLGTNNGKKYYFGDSVNKYLLENKLSVLCFINGAYNYICPGKELPDASTTIKRAVSVVGDDKYKIWDRYLPEEVFKAIKECWDGIFENMTSKYCKNPSEWPILFGIVLQNIMLGEMKFSNPENIYSAVLECTLFVSKMDVDSL